MGHSSLIVFLVSFFIAAAAASAEAAGAAAVTASASRDIECAVCRTATTHVWERATAVLAHCREFKGPDRDDRCDFHQLHPWAIDQMVWGVCDALVEEYKVPAEGPFRLVRQTEAVQHVSEEASMLRDVCVDVFHHREKGGAEEVGATFQAQLESTGMIRAARSEEALRTLHESLCASACASLVDEADAPTVTDIPVHDALPEFPVYEDDDDGEF